MAHDSLRNIRLDRRLLQRRDWIDSEQLEKELSALPDVAQKARRGDEGEPSGGESAASPQERV